MDGKACLEVQLPTMSFIFDLMMLVFVTLFIGENLMMYRRAKLQKKYNTPDLNGFYPIVSPEVKAMGVEQQYPRWPNVCSDCGQHIGGFRFWDTLMHDGHCKNYYHLKRVAYEYINHREFVLHPDPEASEKILKED